jgi:hypothetical protein
MALEIASHPLGVSGDVTLSAREREHLRGIEEYDLWFVSERLARKGAVAPHLIVAAVTEFKKYMALAALGYANIAMLSREVDEVWHNFILFTREYAEFCETNCGGMVHHRPNTSVRPGLPPEAVDDFKEAYARYFGPLPDIWRRAESKGAATSVSAADDYSTRGDCDVTNDPVCESGELSDYGPAVSESRHGNRYLAPDERRSTRGAAGALLSADDCSPRSECDSVNEGDCQSGSGECSSGGGGDDPPGSDCDATAAPADDRAHLRLTL